VPQLNQQIAAAFAELADLLEMTGGERFKILAYRRAAEVLDTYPKDVAQVAEKELINLRGIGRATAKKVREFAETGRMGTLEEMRALIPPGVREMTGLPGVGPKKAMLLHSELGVSNLDELKKAVRQHRLRDVKGLGEKTEENLASALARYNAQERRMLLGTAIDIADGIVSALSGVKGVHQAAYAGSVRRMKETIRDLDILAAADDASVVAEAFTSLPQVARIALKGGTKTSVVVAEGLQVDLRVVAPDEFGAALQYFTGSKQHNVKVREHAVKKGFKLSEYGLFAVSDNTRIAAETEEEVYAALGMQTPLPTMREDLGEVELSLRHELPDLLQVSDIKGELHGHSDYSDGRLKIAEMAGEAMRRGYEYWTVSDHARDLQIRRVLELEDIAAQAVEVEEVNQSLDERFRVLHGIELNVGPDGTVDFPEEVLARFDVRVASIHGAPWDFDSMTRRLIAAAEHPLVNVLGHPSGRRMGRRPAGEFDLDAVFKAAAANKVALEINSNPQRLDLKDEHARVAREYGCYFAIDTDAHKFSDFDYLRLGVGTAQRAWITKSEVINTWPLEQLRHFLAKR
jgi:DNA polymerase (family 10)